MPIITSIKPQKSKRRVNIYLDDKFGFGLDLENFMKLGLKVEQELSENQIREIVKKSEYQKAYEKLLKFATLRPRSEKEVRDWFRRKEVHESIHDKLFSQLKYLELLDDKKFAEWWIRQRLAFSPRGTRALAAELFSKGIDRDLVNELIGGSVNQEDEVKIAKTLLEKKNYKWRGLDERIATKKKTEFLARKGFGWEVIKKVLQYSYD